MKKLIKLKFVLENCECLYIDNISHILKIFTGDIKKNMYIQDDDIFEHYFTNYLQIKIDEKLPLIIKNTDEKLSIYSWERLKGMDVTSVVFYFNNNTELQLYVPWGKKNFENTKMKIEFFKDSFCEHYIITFKEKWSFKDFLPKRYFTKIK